MALKNHYVCCKSQNLKNIINLNNNNISSFDNYNSKYYNGHLNQIFSKDEFSVFHCSNCGHYQYNLDIDQNKINKMYKIHYDLKLLRKKKKSTIK